MTVRTLWFAPDLGIVDEPLWKALVTYRQNNRERVQTPRKFPTYMPDLKAPNLVSSRTTDGRQMPILDMDFPHHFEESSTPGHHHLFIDRPMTNRQWFVLMCALRYAGVIEEGFFAWSIRRWGNFVRLPGVLKEKPEEFVKPTYGWFRKLKDAKR
jgi:hypothetical protein